MRRVVTILAQGQRGQRLLKDGNLFLDHTAHRLVSVACLKKAAFALQSAATLGGIVDALPSVPSKDAPAVQIIGHGKPGKLKLGNSWGTYREDGQLSSDTPFRYLERMRGRISMLYLVACRVAESDPKSPGRDVGGELLKNVSSMLSCEVFGTVGDALCCQFDIKTGLFGGPMRAYSSATGIRDIPEVVVCPRVVAKASTLIDVRVDSVQPDGYLDRTGSARWLTSQEGRRLWEKCTPVEAPRDGGCIVEAACRVTVSSQGATPMHAVLELMSNRRVRLRSQSSVLPPEVVAARWAID